MDAYIKYFVTVRQVNKSKIHNVHKDSGYASQSHINCINSYLQYVVYEKSLCIKNTNVFTVPVNN